MFTIGHWFDSRLSLGFELFQRENQIVCRELNPSLSDGEAAEHTLIDQSTSNPFIVDETLDTPEKQQCVFYLLTKFEISKEGGGSLLPYNPCHVWELTASQVAILYRAVEPGNPDHLIWHIINNEERREFWRMPADSALTAAVQACLTPEERTRCLKDRRITLERDDRGCLRSIVAEQIKSKLDSSKVLTSEDWAVTVVVRANPRASLFNFAEFAGHTSIVIESVEDLTHKIQCADLRAKDLKWTGSGRAVVHLNEFDPERFDTTIYQGQSETMVIPSDRVLEMMLRIKWEIAQQEQGTPKVLYHAVGSAVNGPAYRVIDTFDSAEIYVATQIVDPPSTAFTSSLAPSAALEAYEALDDLTDESSTLEIIGAMISPLLIRIREKYNHQKKLKQIAKQAKQIEEEAYRAAIEAQRQPSQRGQMDALIAEKGIRGAAKVCTQHAREAGRLARETFLHSCRAEIPNLIRVRERPSFRPERGGSKDYVDVERLPDNCNTWAMHMVSLLGKRLDIDLLSEIASFPSLQRNRFASEDMPLPPQYLPTRPYHFLELIRQTKDPIRIKIAERLLASIGVPLPGNFYRLHVRYSSSGIRLVSEVSLQVDGE